MHIICSICNIRIQANYRLTCFCYNLENVAVELLKEAVRVGGHVNAIKSERHGNYMSVEIDRVKFHEAYNHYQMPIFRVFEDQPEHALEPL